MELCDFYDNSQLTSIYLRIILVLLLKKQYLFLSNLAGTKYQWLGYYSQHCRLDDCMDISANILPHKAEVVIIGGGVIGTVTAYVLAKAGIQVLLIDQKEIGSGTTSKAAAAALLQTKTSAKKLALANRSLKLLDDLHDQLDGRFEYAHTGSLLAATTEDEFQLIRQMYTTLQSLGLKVDLLDGQQAREMMPILGPSVIGASYSPRDAQINPLELVVACAQAAKRFGTVFANYTKLLGIEIEGESIVAVQTSAGRVLTDTVINAAGVWASEVARFGGVQLHISPLKGELLVTERLPPLMRGTLIAAKYLLSKARAEGEAGGRTPKRTVGITLVQVAHGNLIVGSTRELAEYDMRSTFAGIHELVKQLLELTPALAHVHLLRGYAGLRPLTPDGSPIISRTPQIPGFIQVAGFGGDGLAMSAITADMILGLLTGNADQELLANFTLERFSPSEISL
jgi:glycine/D-amino acid oxidase-like deaminating enzyme